MRKSINSLTNVCLLIISLNFLQCYTMIDTKKIEEGINKLEGSYFAGLSWYDDYYKLDLGGSISYPYREYIHCNIDINWAYANFDFRSITFNYLIYPIPEQTVRPYFVIGVGAGQEASFFGGWDKIDLTGDFGIGLDVNIKKQIIRIDYRAFAFGPYLVFRNRFVVGPIFYF